MLTKPVLLIVVFILSGAGVNLLYAHCDSLNGPVIQDARMALEKEEITPVLKWIQSDDEQEIRSAFKQTVAVRKLNPEAQKIADQFFFETLVRIHRKGEGAPFTGLRPPDSIDPVMEETDHAIASGDAEQLINETNQRVENALRKQFAEVLERKKTVDRSVQDGRAYVRAYVEFLHSIEAVYNSTAGAPPEHHD